MLYLPGISQNIEEVGGEGCCLIHDEDDDCDAIKNDAVNGDVRRF